MKLPETLDVITTRTHVQTPNSQLLPAIPRSTQVASRPARPPVAIAYLDAPNITSILFHANGGNAKAAVDTLDLATLRAELFERYDVRRFYYVVAANGRNARAARCYQVRSFDWSFVQAHRHSALNRDPADAFIIEGILAATSQLALTGPATVVLISNDGGYAQPCRNLLAAGGHLVVAGFTHQLSGKLRALGTHPQCDILDLRRDLRAVSMRN